MTNGEAITSSTTTEPFITDSARAGIPGLVKHLISFDGVQSNYCTGFLPVLLVSK